ncbi:hypothetical protein QYM36_010620, partial [Artemia franciscana]
EIFVADTTENTTLISPEAAQYHSEKDSYYNFAQNDVFPQSVMDMVATGGDSGFDRKKTRKKQTTLNLHEKCF